MPNQPLGPTGLLAQSMTLPAGSQSMSMGGMRMRAQGMDGRKKGGAGNWLGLSGNATQQWAIDGAVDGQGNLLVAGSFGSPSNALLVGRYAPTGERNWSAEVSGTNPSGGFTAGNLGSAAIATDAAGNAYVVSGNGSTTVETLKISPAGQLVWGRTYTAGTNAFGRAVAVGASGGVYVLMRTDGGGYGGSTVLVVKYSPAGSFQWSRNVDLQVDYGLALDASENVYVTTSSQAVVKLNSSGVLQWASEYASGDGPGQMIRMAASASGETYAACSASGEARLWAFDASGAVRWARGLGAPGSWWNDVFLSGQSLYCIGVTSLAGAGSNDILLAEYDTSGTLKWQRTIGGAGNDYGFAIAEADANTLAIYGSTSLGEGAGDVFIGRVPKSGPPAGKIGPYTVTASSLTAANLSSTFTGVSPATQTLGSDAASSLTPTSIALTTSIYPF